MVLERVGPGLTCARSDISFLLHFLFVLVSSCFVSSMASEDPSQDLTSPYYLHLGENPQAVLVSPQFDGSNYHSWSRAMKRVLLSKNKFNFVSGEILEPTLKSNQYEA